MPEPEPRLPPRLRTLGEAFTDPDSYGLVLLSIVVTYAIAVTLTNTRAASLIIAVQVLTVWLALRASRARRPVRAAADVALAVALVAAVVGLLLDIETTGDFLPVISCILYLIAPLSIVRDLLHRYPVDQETILGAIATYLLAGMFFAFVYRSLGANGSGDFFGSGGDGTLPQDLFFSFTTLTTTGYGNLVPAGNPGQSIAAAEMLFGQLFLVTAVARAVASYQRGQRRRGLRET